MQSARSLSLSDFLRAAARAGADRIFAHIFDALSIC
jgi:hypothetical protein